jgi:glucuronate isomerase
MTGRVLPTFRSDRYLDPHAPGWAANLDLLAAAADVDTGTYAGLLAALRARRAFFKTHGATATDTGVVTADCEPLLPAEAETLHRRLLAAARAGTPPDSVDAARYRADLLFRAAEMSADDGLVMQLHAGVARNHHPDTLRRFGPDTGHDLPLATAFVRPLAPMLAAFGTDPAFRLVLFTVDETTLSREVAPLAGFYPSVYAGAPWWFLDTPAAMLRYRAAVTDAAGFRKTSGFIDDTRAFCSIPVRHDVARRVDAAFLAGLVTSGQLGEEEAARIAVDLVDTRPREVFRLG